VSSGGTVTYLHHDQQGSTRLLTSSSGEVVGKCSYGAYGSPDCEGSEKTPLGYDGQYTNANTGLIYLRAREYDPSTGQFVSEDPLKAITGAPYSYAGDNPLNESDPTGEGIFGTIGELLFPGGGSGQACIGGTVSYGGVSVGLEGCYVHTPGGEGLAGTVSLTRGPGIGINVHAGAGESNACRPSEYGGLFSQLGGSAEFPTGGYYNRFSNFPLNKLSGSRPVEGWTAGGSVGIGAEAGVGGSYTFTIPIGGGSGGSGSSGCGC
jgi:RHS repeat-associated protein